MKITINTFIFWKVFIDIITYHRSLSNSIVKVQGQVFNLKFLSLLSYFLDIRKKLFTTLYF